MPDRVPGDVPGNVPGNAASPTTDGRHLRSERSHAAIVDAMLGLLREGNINPSSTDIAGRAGVTQRTVFNHFADMDSLMMAVATRNGEHILPLVPECDPSGSLDERIERFCDGTAQLLEASQHIRWAVLTHPNGKRFGALAVQFMRELMRERLVGTFGPELDAMTPALRDTVIEILEIEIDPTVWRMRRVQNGVSSEQAGTGLRTAFRLILT